MSTHLIRTVTRSPRQIVRTAAGLVIVMIAVLVSSGCDSSGGITRSRIEKSVAPTFSNLWVVTEAQHGRKITASALRTKVQCIRGDNAEPDKGPGEDWSCNLAWIENAAGVPGAAAYTLHVHPNGCYSADGDGPVDLNGSPSLTRPDGASVVNPLWQFDGCFDNS